MNFIFGLSLEFNSTVCVRIRVFMVLLLWNNWWRENHEDMRVCDQNVCVREHVFYLFRFSNYFEVLNFVEYATKIVEVLEIILTHLLQIKSIIL